MINDPFHPEEAIAREKESTKRKLLAVVCAVAVTAVLFVGYAFFRKRHAQQTLAAANAQVSTPGSTDIPKGPPLAHIVIDEPMLEKGITIIGGGVKNISERELTNLAIALELKRRKDGVSEQTLVPVAPAQLQPDQEGTYALRLPAQDYGSIRLVGLKADPNASLIAYTTSPGKKRPPEKLESRTIVIKRSGRAGEFINTPDNPTRVP